MLREVERLPHSITNVEYRLRHQNGSWRHVESSITNLLADPMVGGIVLNTRDITERKRAGVELQRLQSERAKLLDWTVLASEQERKRLAAELHDGPVQHLTALDLMMERLRLTLNGDGGLSSQLAERVQGRLREEVGGLRRMMVELRPPILDERGLEAALKDHLRVFEQQAGLECFVESKLTHRLDATRETVLYRVAQEALTNVVKHAQAKRAWVSLTQVRGDVVLEIRDDGVGFDSTNASELVPKGHYGLLGMRERVEMAGGRWEVESSPGTGAVVRALFPAEAVLR
jgi:two-component system sensor histidine kinase UhpB